MKIIYFAAAACAALASAPAAAAAVVDAPFTGPYAGAEAGIIEHHFYLEASSGGTVVSKGYHRSWGAGGGAFAGADLAVSRRLRLGVEAGATVGGATNRAAFPAGISLALDPSHGYRLTARGGLVVGSDLLLYASGGYGGNSYRVSNSAGVTGVDKSGSSFIVGGGAEYRLSRRVGLRLDYKHVDNQTHQFFVGIPVRL